MLNPFPVRSLAIHFPPARRLLIALLPATLFLGTGVHTPAAARTTAAGAIAWLSSGRSDLGQQKPARLPDGLYPALIKAELHTASPAYRVHAVDDSVVARNPADHLAVRFTRSGVAISPSGLASTGVLHLQFAGLDYSRSGRSGQTLPSRLLSRAGTGIHVGAYSMRPTELQRPWVPRRRAHTSVEDGQGRLPREHHWAYALRPYWRDAIPVISGQRITYHRGPVQEWYVNGPAGLEQGFTLASPPAARSMAPLVLALQVRGAQSAHPQSGSIIFTLAGSHGSAGTTLRYGDLYVHDATGRRLPAHFQLGTGQPGALWARIAPAHPEPRTRNSKLRTQNSELKIVIRDRRARYPLTVDPVFAAAITPGTQYALSARGALDLGFSVAMSGDGSVALVGAPETNGGAGAAFIFTEPSGGWADTGSPAAELTVSGSGKLGTAVALNGDGSVVLIDGEVNNTGDVAFVFTESNAGWMTTATPTATLTAADAGFPVAVALNGDGSVALVGDKSVSVYIEPSTGWSGGSQPVATLSVPTTIAFPTFSVALSANGRIALLSAGSPTSSSSSIVAFMYVEPGGGWATTSTPNATLTTPGSGVEGEAVALSGDGATALVGDKDFNSGTGEALVFVEPSSGWSNTVSSSATLSVARLPTSSFFGYTVSLSGVGDIALIGAPFRSSDAGGAYIFRKPSGGWASTTNPDEPLFASGGNFGESVALSGDGSLILVGAPQTQGGGTAYVRATSMPLSVDGNGGNDNNDCSSASPCKTIQTAVSKAWTSGLSGATITIAGANGVFNGMYCEHITTPFSPLSLNLRAADPSHPPVIDGGGSGTSCPSANSGPVISVGATVDPATYTYLSLSNLTIQHGGGTTVDTVTFGGGIFDAGGTLYLSHVTVTANSATGQTTCSTGGSAQGGGIVNLSSGSLFLDDVTVSGNTASGGAGTVRTSCNGGAAIGGGIGNFGTMLLRGSTVETNQALGGSSGIFGGVGGTAAGGGIENLGNLWVMGSTIGGNSAIGGASSSSVGGRASASGGGINLEGNGDVPPLLVNSTIAANRAQGGLSGVAGAGGGLNVNAGSFTLLDDTVAQNSAPTGGGIAGPSGKTAAFLMNTILATNTDTKSDPDCAAKLADANVYISYPAGTISTGGHNILGDQSAGCSGLAGSTSVDQIGTDANPINPDLDPNGLQDNGGPTKTIALLVSSPAIGKAASLFCQPSSVNPALGESILGDVDQRGYPRNTDSRNACDIGAYDTNALNVAKGWNLIGIPTPSSSTNTTGGLIGNLDGQLGANAIAAVATYSHGSFQLSVPNFSAGRSLQPSQGIFVLSAKAGVWVPPGRVAYASGQPVQLLRGWNLAAAPFPLMGLTGDQIDAQLGPEPPFGCLLKEVAILSGGTYRTYTPGTAPAGTGFKVFNTTGMWIECGGLPYTWTPA